MMKLFSCFYPVVFVAAVLWTGCAAQKHHTEVVIVSTNDIHAAIDRMVQVQGWLCPIQADKREDGAFYSPLKDRIVVPMKAQFNIGNTPEETFRGGMEY